MSTAWAWRSRLALTSLLMVAAGACAPAPPPVDDVPPPRLPPRLSACFGDHACHTPMVVAHRGEGGTAPENTVASIRELAALGADVVEIDVRETADGVAVLLHDSTLTRTTDQAALFPERAELSQLTFAELLTLTIDHPGCAAGDQALDVERCRVPTLADALRAARDACVLMLDFKNADAARVAALVAAEDALDVAWAFDANEATLDAFEAVGALTMPRAEDVASAADLIARRGPPAVHIDPAYQAEAATLAAATDTKLLVNLFTTVDLNLAAAPLTGDESLLLTARDELVATLDAGIGIVQTNFAPAVRELVDEWRAAHPDAI